MHSFSGLQKNMSCHSKPHKNSRKASLDNFLIRKIADFRSAIRAFLEFKGNIQYV